MRDQIDFLCMYPTSEHRQLMVVPENYTCKTKADKEIYAPGSREKLSYRKLYFQFIDLMWKLCENEAVFFIAVVCGIQSVP